MSRRRRRRDAVTALLHWLTGSSSIPLETLPATVLGSLSRIRKSVSCCGSR
jgi:hypothetical protein